MLQWKIYEATRKNMSKVRREHRETAPATASQ